MKKNELVERYVTNIPTRDLALILAGRPDLPSLLRDDGLIPPEFYTLRTELGVVGTVDCVAIQVEGGVLQGGVIRRKTGEKFVGLLALVGGIVAKNESIAEAVQRHWGQDLGLSVEPLLGWDWPVAAHQYAPTVAGGTHAGFGEDPVKHSFGPDYAVKIIGNWRKAKPGIKIGGQEAIRLEWYSAASCPPEAEWGYNMRTQFLTILGRIEMLMRKGVLQ